MTRTGLAPSAPAKYRSAAGDKRWDPLAPKVVAVARRLVDDPFWVPTPADLALLSPPPLPYFLVAIGTRHGE